MYLQTGVIKINDINQSPQDPYYNQSSSKVTDALVYQQTPNVADLSLNIDSKVPSAQMTCDKSPQAFGLIESKLQTALQQQRSKNKFVSKVSQLNYPGNDENSNFQNRMIVSE